MTMIEALLATQNDQLLARPVGGHYRGGYYIAQNMVWYYNPLHLAADLKSIQPVHATFPAALLLDVEWEVVPR